MHDVTTTVRPRVNTKTVGIAVEMIVNRTAARTSDLIQVHESLSASETCDVVYHEHALLYFMHTRYMHTCAPQRRMDACIIVEMVYCCLIRQKQVYDWLEEPADDAKI